MSGRGVSCKGIRNGKIPPLNFNTKSGQNSRGEIQKMAKKRLKSLEDCRRYLAGLINRVEDQDVDQQTASKLAYIANILISCIKDSSLEERITKLEESIGGKRKKQQ